MTDNHHDAFCSQVEQLLQKKEITLNDVQKCLLMITRTTLDLPILSKLFLKYCFISTNIRKIFLLPAWIAWQKREKKILESLPEEPMALCNQLSTFLFPSSDKTLSIVKAEEKVKTEQDIRNEVYALMKEAAFFKDILHQVEQIATTKETDLTSFAKEIRERKQELYALEQKTQVVKEAKKQISSSIPPLFAQLPQKNAQWDEVIQLLISPFELLLPASFSTKSSFIDWIAQQTKRIDSYAAAISLMQKAQQANNELQDYFKEIQYYHEPLVSSCGKAFVSYIENALFQSGINLVSLIKQQREGMQFLDLEIKKRYADLQRRSLPYISEFMTPHLRQYPDLYKEATRLVESTTSTPFQGLVFLDEETKNQALHKLDHFLGDLVQDIANLVLIGKTRNKKIREIETFQTEYSKQLRGLTNYLDMHKQYAEEMQALQALNINKQLFLKMKTQDIDLTIDTQYSVYLRMKEASAEKMRQFKEMTTSLYQQCQDSTHTLKRRLCEIFSQKTSYPDLHSSLSQLHALMKNDIQEKQKLFFNGKMTIDALRIYLSNLAYDHDVKLLRNEIGSRTKRLRELRAACLILIQSLQINKRYFEIMQLIQSEHLYRNIVDLSSECKKILAHLENPFELFKDSMTFESVNATTKRIWLQIEERQKKAAELMKQCEHIFKKHADRLQPSLFKLLDDIEEITLEKKGKRPNLYHIYEQKLKEGNPQLLWTQLFQICDEVESKFPYVMPITFFLLIEDSANRKQCLRESATCFEHINETIAFAKSMQYIKTFEEECVDDFLEVFEHKQLLLENEYTSNESITEWRRYITLMEDSCFQVHEELFLDIGLLDQKALLDIEEDKLVKTIKNAVLRAKLHLEGPTRGTIAMLKKLPETATHNQLLEALNRWIMHSQKGAENSQEWLKRLRVFCNLLFQARVFINEPKGDRSALCATMLLNTRSLVDHLEDLLQTKKEKSQPLQFVNLWVDECHLLQETIEAWEVEQETTEIYTSYFQKICNTIEAILENSQHEFSLLRYKESLNLLLQRLSENS